MQSKVEDETHSNANRRTKLGTLDHEAIKHISKDFKFNNLNSNTSIQDGVAK